MDRTIAYRILVDTLEEWRKLPFDDLEGLRGQTSDLTISRAGVDYRVFVDVLAPRDQPDTLRVEVSVGTSSTWLTERLEESATVRR